jgi:hypothetical protein
LKLQAKVKEDSDDLQKLMSGKRTISSYLAKGTPEDYKNKLEH